MNTEHTQLPKEARNFLDSFYTMRGIATDDVVGKIGALRQQFIRDELFIASSEGYMDDQGELVALENYVLATFGLI